MGKQTILPQKNTKIDANSDIPLEMLENFVETSKLNALNEAKELTLREKELELNDKHAERVLNAQLQLQTQRGGETRKNIITISGVLAFFILIAIGFLVYCINKNETEFAYNILKGFSYFLSALIGWFAKGKATSIKNSSKDSEYNDDDDED